MSKTTTDTTDFQEIAHIDYRGYIILLSASHINTLEQEMKYQIFHTKEEFDKREDIYDSSDDMYIYKSLESTIQLAKEWIDMTETFSKLIQ